MDKNSKLIKSMVMNALLIALCVVLSLISNYIPIGGLTINLSLFVISIAAILFGPISGFLVGLVNGALTMLVAGPFFAINPVATVFVCLLKTSIAGLLAGYTYRLFANKNRHVGVILATLLVPIINTTIFIIGSLLFFKGLFGELITIFVSINFIVEVVISAVLTPSIYYLSNYYNSLQAKKRNQG